MASGALAKLRALLLALPGTDEKSSWGHPNFHTSARSYCAFHEHRSGVPCIWLRLDPLAAELMRDDPRILSSSHGGQGWIGVNAGGRIDWSFVRELARDAHSLALPKPRRARPKAAAAKPAQGRDRTRRRSPA
ncbi:MAG: MmcQ/YjbR family DNA-binding protein [Myxococcota bacterium]